jgi:TPP-dependent pyruvate/acetoin dehydrogenase alpha subunit
VFRATRQAVERARAGQGPSIVEAFVPRITSHSSQDDDSYRTEAERAEAVSRDPLPRLRELLLEYGLLEHDEEDRLTRDLHAQARSEADRAVAQPEPDPSRARHWLFAGDAPHPELAALEATPLGPGLFDDVLPPLTPPALRSRSAREGASSANGHAGRPS